MDTGQWKLLLSSFDVQLQVNLIAFRRGCTYIAWYNLYPFWDKLTDPPNQRFAGLWAGAGAGHSKDSGWATWPGTSHQTPVSYKGQAARKCEEEIGNLKKNIKGFKWCLLLQNKQRKTKEMRYGHCIPLPLQIRKE